MSFNAIGQYTPNYKSWDHIQNIIPKVDFSEGIRPGSFQVAPWLPVQLWDKKWEHWFVLMPGKGVALDNDGDIIPAGLGVAGATITYSTDDVTAGVMDVRTGETLLLANVGTFTVASIDGTPGFKGRTGVAADFGKFIGICPYPYWKRCGDGSSNDTGYNPAYYVQHNFMLQPKIAILCDYVIEVPQVPAQTATEATTFAAPTAGVSTNTLDPLDNLPVAKNTIRTPITFADGGSGHGATLFLVEKSSASDLAVVGDWYIDTETGIISVYSGTTTPNGITVTYYNYASAPTGTSVSRFACALGDLEPGDFVKFNVDSNYVIADPTTEYFDTICGQVIGFETFPRDGLDKVKTAHSSLSTSGTGALPGYSGQFDQMPGTATGGVSDKIHYAGAANKTVLINLISR